MRQFEEICHNYMQLADRALGAEKKAKVLENENKLLRFELVDSARHEPEEDKQRIKELEEELEGLRSAPGIARNTNTVELLQKELTACSRENSRLKELLAHARKKG